MPALANVDEMARVRKLCIERGWDIHNWDALNAELLDSVMRIAGYDPSDVLRIVLGDCSAFCARYGRQQMWSVVAIAPGTRWPARASRAEFFTGRFPADWISPRKAKLQAKKAESDKPSSRRSRKRDNTTD